MSEVSIVSNVSEVSKVSKVREVSEMSGVVGSRSESTETNGKIKHGAAPLSLLEYYPVLGLCRLDRGDAGGCCGGKRGKRVGILINV